MLTFSTSEDTKSLKIRQMFVKSHAYDPVLEKLKTDQKNTVDTQIRPCKERTRNLETVQYQDWT